MKHVRDQIRDALKAKFDDIDGLSGRVVADASEIQPATEAPWVELVIGPEAVTNRTLGSSVGGKRLMRQLRVSAWVHIRGYADAIERQGEILAQLEAKAFQERKLDGLLLSALTLESIQPAEPDRSGSLPRHSALITWSCTYSTTEADATVPNFH